MWTCRSLCLYLLTVDLVYGLQESLSDDEIIEGGRNISVFLWGFIFTLLSIVATWYYLNLEDTGSSAMEEQDKETEVAMRIVHQLSEEDSKKPQVVTSQFCAKSPVRNESKNLAANGKTSGFEDGETSILCSKYDWEENSGADSEDTDSQDRFRRRSMEEMSLIFPGFLPKITEEEEESESSGSSEETSESAIAQTSDIKLNSSPNKSYTQPIHSAIGPLQDVNKTSNDFDRLYSSVNTEESKIEPILVAKKPGMRASDTNVNAVVKGRENYSSSNTSLGGTNVACETKLKSPQILQEEESFTMCSKSEILSETPDFEIGPNISELNTAELRIGHAKNGSYSSQENDNFEAKEIISGHLEPRSKKPDSDVTLRTKSVISPHMNGYVAENGIVDIEPAIEDKESLHFNDSRSKDVEKYSKFLSNGLPPKPEILSSDKNTELNDSVRDPIESFQDKIAVQVQDLEIESKKRNTRITDCNFNEFTNVLNQGNISDLHEQSVVDENLNSTHAWTFFSMSSEAEKADNILETERVKSFSEKVQDAKSVPKIVVESCEELSSEGQIKSDDTSRPAEISETKQNNNMDPNTFETDIDVDDIDLDDDEQLEEGEFSMYFKRPVSVTDLDKIIETTGASRENIESKRAKVRNGTDVERIVAEIAQKKNLSVHVRNNQPQETNLDELDNNSEVELEGTQEQTARSTTMEATNHGMIDQNGLLYGRPISGNVAFTTLVDTGESFSDEHGPRDEKPNGLEVTPGEVSVAIVTLESEKVYDFEAAPGNLSVTPDSKAKIDLATEWKDYENHARTIDQERVAPVPGQLGKIFEDLPSQETVAPVLQDMPSSKLANSQVTPAAVEVEETVVVNDIEVTESAPGTRHDTLPELESVVVLESTHPAYESANKKPECSTDKAVCAESEGHQVCDIETAEIDYTTDEEEDQTKFTLGQKANENIEESEATCITQEECELSNISLDEIDFVSDSENLSLTLETPEIIENDEAIEINEEFAEYSILNPTRTRSKYLISGITRLPTRRSKSFSSKSFLSEDNKSEEKSDFSKLQLEKPSPGTQNMGLRIILTGHAKTDDNTKHASKVRNGTLESPNYSSDLQHDRKTPPVTPTKKYNVSKSTDALHEPKVQKISFGMEETVFRASTSDVEASPPGESPKFPFSPLHDGDAFELNSSPKTYTAKITMQENLPDRRRIIVLNVRKKSPGTARWKSMNDIDQMRSAISDITRELEENPSLEDHEDKEPIVQRFRADTPVEIMVPYKDEETPRREQVQSLESGYCSPVLREDERAGALSPPTVRHGIYESRTSPEASGSVCERNNTPLSPHYRKTQETIFAISAEPLSEMMIPKQHEDMVTTTASKPEVGGIIQETAISVDFEPTLNDTGPIPSKSVDVHSPEQNIGTRLKTPSPPPVHIRTQGRVARETTFPVYSKPVSNTNEPEKKKSRSIFSPQPSDATVCPPHVQIKKSDSKRTTETVFAVSAEPRKKPVQFGISTSEDKKATPTINSNWEPQQSVNRSLSPVVVERKVHEREGQKETVFVVSAEPQSSAMNKDSKERRDAGDKKIANASTCTKESSVFGVFAKSKTVKAIPVSKGKAISPTEEITVKAVAVSKRTSTTVLAKEIKKTERTTHVKARLDPASEAIVNVFSDEEDNARSPYRRDMQGKPVEPVIETVDASEAPLIHAFPVNDGYDDEELDDVFIEYGPPLGYQTKQPPLDSRIPPSSMASQQRTRISSLDREIGSYDADSETSSVPGQLTPQRVRHLYTKSSQQAASGNVQLSESDTDESSSTPTNATPTAFQQESSAFSGFEPYSRVLSNSAPDSRFPKEDDIITAAVMVGSRSNNPQYYEAVGLIEQATDESTEEEMYSLKLRKASEKELPHFSGSAFKPVNDTEKLAVKRPLPRSDGFVPRERSASAEEALLLAGQIHDKNTDDKFFSYDTRGLCEMDSGKSMPNLHKQGEMPEPNVSKLNSHTRMWLSQNTGIDFDGEDMMTSELFLYPSSRLDLTMDDDMSDTLSTRPQTPMSEFSYAGETPYAGLRRDSRTVITCANTYCCKEEVLYGLAKTSFTSCPACFTYYCSRDCRRINWREHKKICFFGRINSYIRSFVYYCNRKEELRLHLSKIAKSGYKKKGRGCIMVMFTSPQLARNFMTTGCKVFPSPPSYSALSELKVEGKSLSVYFKTTSYNRQGLVVPKKTGIYNILMTRTSPTPTHVIHLECLSCSSPPIIDVESLQSILTVQNVYTGSFLIPKLRQVKTLVGQLNYRIGLVQ